MTVLFLGTRIGYEALLTLVEIGEKELTVFVDSEHDHENEKYVSKVVELCEAHQLNVIKDASLKNIEEYVGSRSVDLISCFGFRRMLSKNVIKSAEKVALSTHFSMLPEYRGFAPVNWAIINGESRCGVSLFHVDEEMDAGDLVAQKEVVILEQDYASDVLDKCIEALKEILELEWPEFKRGYVKRIPQEHDKATYTCARSPEDGEIDWSNSTNQIYNLIRGISNPFPGAFTYFGNDKLAIWTAEPVDVGKYVGRTPGKVIKIVNGKGVIVLTGDGALLIKKIGKEQDSQIIIADYLIKSVRVKLG